MIRNLRLRNKLMVLLVAPVVALAVFAGLQVGSKVTAVHLDDRYNAVRQGLSALAGLEASVQNEGAQSAYFLASRGTGHASELAAARTATDASIAGLARYRLQLEKALPSAAGNVNALFDQINVLVSASRVDVGKLDPRVLADSSGYFAGIDGQIQAVMAKAATSFDDGAIQIGLIQTSTALGIADQAAVIRTVLLAGFGSGHLGIADYGTLNAARASRDRLAATFENRATPAELAAYRAGVAANSQATQSADTILSEVLAGALSPTSLGVAAWNSVSNGGVKLGLNAAASTQAQLDSLVHARRVSDERGAGAYVAGAALALLIALGLGWIIVRGARKAAQAAAVDAAKRQTELVRHGIGDLLGNLARHQTNSVALGEIVIAVIGEVAGPERVDVTNLDSSILIKGPVVAGLAHLLGELLANATTFSPPETRIDVYGLRRADAYVLAVTDQGPGMDDEGLSRANALISHPPLDGAGLSGLGFLVVGHLAGAHGIGVRLRRADCSGITALITLPAEVLGQVPAPPVEPVPAPPVEPVPLSPVEPVPAAAARPASEVVNASTSGRNGSGPAGEPPRPSPRPVRRAMTAEEARKLVSAFKATLGQSPEDGGTSGAGLSPDGDGHADRSPARRYSDRTDDPS